MLWKEAGEKRWSYPQFISMWPNHQFGEVSHMRWENKKKIEKAKRSREGVGGQREGGGKKQRKG
jgi:hypothetical protein